MKYTFHFWARKFYNYLSKTHKIAFFPLTLALYIKSSSCICHLFFTILKRFSALDYEKTSIICDNYGCFFIYFSIFSIANRMFSACVMAEITATPATFVSRTAATFSRAIPPIATTGFFAIFVSWQSF